MTKWSLSGPRTDETRALIEIEPKREVGVGVKMIPFRNRSSTARLRALVPCAALVVTGLAVPSSTAAQSHHRTPPSPATPTATCPARTAADTGAIEGSLYFPGPLPAMSVVAIRQEPAANGCAYFVTVARGVDRYALTGLPAGDYLLVAYATDASGHARAGGYTDSVTCMAGCGGHGNCCRGARHVSHVIHLHGERIRHISIADWDASLPAKPAGVP
jgi:hypothetical protein